MPPSAGLWLLLQLHWDAMQRNRSRHSPPGWAFRVVQGGRLPIAPVVPSGPPSGYAGEAVEQQRDLSLRNYDAFIISTSIVIASY